jgi:hypothetical protein
MSPTPLRAVPGSRPADPVRQGSAPDDRWCTWIYRLEEWTGTGQRTGFWELKFISAMCPAHNKLPTARRKAA